MDWYIAVIIFKVENNQTITYEIKPTPAWLIQLRILYLYAALIPPR